MEKTFNSYIISDDKERLDITYIHRFLSLESYWAQNIPISVVKSAIKGSLCFGIYQQERQIGFARVITDYATFGYLADVFIDANFRGQGLSKELLKFIMGAQQLKGLRRFMLATKDAHTLYQQFGFRALKEPDRFLEIKPFERY